MGATWLATNSDGTTTRTGVMQFAAANSNGITVAPSTNFDSATGTVTFWMRSAGTTNAPTGASLFCVPVGQPGNDFIIAQLSGLGNLQVESPNNGTGPAALLNTSTSVSDDKWHFIAVTYDSTDNGGVAAFVDGAFNTTNANSASWSMPTGEPIEIGYSTDATFSPYDGSLSDVRFYSTELTSNQIVSIYQSGALANTNALQMQLDFAAPPVVGSILSWQESSAVLQSATDVNGPYTDVPGVSSPYTIVPSATQMFFRYRYVTQSLVSNPYLM
jgi:hypothetical protein